MKRITFLVRTLNIETGGGSHFNAIEQIRLFREMGYKVDVYSFTNGHNHPPLDIDVIKSTTYERGFFNEQRLLKKFLQNKEDHTDIFFLYGVDFMWGAGKYRKDGGKKPVAIYLDTYLPSMFILNEHTLFHSVKRYAWEKFYGIKIANKVDNFFAVSPWVRDVYIKKGFDPKLFKIFPNFFPSVKSLQKKKISRQDINFLYTGRVTYDKGLDMLIESFSKQTKRNWHLRIVGEGNMLNKCKEMVKEKKLEEKITFTPWLSQADLSEVYKTADIFVHPARWPEPFGRTIVESLQSGVPVIVPKSGGSNWIAGDAGYIFENGNLKSLTEVINIAIRDLTSENVSLEKKALARAQFFSKENFAPKAKNLLEEMHCVL